MTVSSDCQAKIRLLCEDFIVPVMGIQPGSDTGLHCIFSLLLLFFFNLLYIHVCLLEEGTRDIPPFTVL